jgi:hypothetical protein
MAAAMRPLPRAQCAACGAAQERGKKLQMCSVCMEVGYCGKECQTEHWKRRGGGHKQQCKGRSKQAATASKEKT